MRDSDNPTTSVPETKNPTPKEVQLIYKDTYNFYTKWIAVKEPDWQKIIDESREIEHKYPFDLCSRILVELVKVIETAYMERSKENV